MWHRKNRNMMNYELYLNGISNDVLFLLIYWRQSTRTQDGCLSSSIKGQMIHKSIGEIFFSEYNELCLFANESEWTCLSLEIDFPLCWALGKTWNGSHAKIFCYFCKNSLNEQKFSQSIEKRAHEIDKVNLWELLRAALISRAWGEIV